MKVPASDNPQIVTRAAIIAGPWHLRRHGVPFIGRGATLRLQRLLACWRERVRERRRLRSLSALDDQLLRDIGFTRSELLHEALKPFWRAGAPPREKGSIEARAMADLPAHAVYRVTRSHLLLPVGLALASSGERRTLRDRADRP
jgi:uncharacterized protein YjiS (DUF1127 family)